MDLVGHKVIRVIMRNGVPTGEYEDFATSTTTTRGDGRPGSRPATARCS
jgi:hypothetical protein